MGKTTRIMCGGFSIIPIIVGVLQSSGIKDVNENNVYDYLKGDTVSVSDFIETNTLTFVEEYNKYIINENQTTEEPSQEEFTIQEQAVELWHATYVENRFEIIINECDEEYIGTFLDFDGDNGYAVVGNDYNFLDFVTSGESPYAGIETDSYYFSVSSGYFYLEDGEFLSVNKENNTDDNFAYNYVMSKTYDGQENNQTGCGKIEYPDRYVNAKYGGGWSLSKSTSLNMIGHEQSGLSCYKENKYNKTYNTYDKFSEGNCWMVSAYNVLQYLANTKWKNMPQYIDTGLNYRKYGVLYNPSKEEPNIYSKYFDSNGNNKSKLLYNTSEPIYQYELVKGNIMFPALYTDVRRYVNEKYKKVNSGTVFATSNVIENVAKQYGYNVEAIRHYQWSWYSNIGTKELDNGKPLLWSTSNDTYSAHTMAVCGYRYYSKVTGWWILKNTKYKLFYELRDGHESAPRFYDMSGHAGFSVIISLDIGGKNYENL